MAVISAKDFIDALVARGIPEHIAQGVAMNVRDESGFNTGINEANPIAGRGGYGLLQWTGPRRIALEDFAKSRGATPDDFNTQLDFFMNETQGSESPAWKKVMASPDARAAGVNFLLNYERPATSNAVMRSARYQNSIPKDLYWDDKGFHKGPATAGQPAAPQPASPVSAEPRQQSFAENVADAFSGLGKGFTAQQPTMAQFARPQFTGTGGEVMPMIASNPFDDMRRSQYAALMQTYGIR